MEECMTLLAGSIMAATVVLPCYAIFKMVLEPPEDEYKYDGENEEHSIFAVVKTKKSLVDYAKDLINKVKGN